MTTRKRCHGVLTGLSGALLVLLGGVSADSVGAQEELSRNTTLYRSGQGVQPVYEGFERHPDGTYTMWFGYLNRNYNEKPHIPVGTDNFFQVAQGVTEPGPVDPELVLDDPGPTDRGQPTYFHPRRQTFVFGVNVPADFGEKNLVWTVMRNGEAWTAIGSLTPEWVWAVDEGVWRANRGTGLGGRTDFELVNKPPTVEFGGPAQLTADVGESVTLEVRVSDDRLPGVPEEQGERRERNYEFQLSNPDLPFTGGDMSSGGGGLGPADANVVNLRDAMETGLAVTWMQYRGPGTAEFDPVSVSLEPDGGQAQTSVRFDRPGTYVVRAYADDTSFTRSGEVTVVVR